MLSVTFNQKQASGTPMPSAGPQPAFAHILCNPTPSRLPAGLTYGELKLHPSGIRYTAIRVLSESLTRSLQGSLFIVVAAP
jgi:hypothetical protein